MSFLKGLLKKNYISLRVIIIIFKTLALAPLTLTIRRSSNIHKNNRFIIKSSNSFYASMYNLIVTLASIVALPCFIIFYRDNPALSKIKNPCLQRLHLMTIDIGLHCMSTATVIFFYVKRKILVSIINKIIYVHNELKENLIYNSQWRDNTCEVLIVVLQIIITFIVNMRTFETKQQLSSFYNIAAGCILEGVVIQYALCVNFLRKLILSLNESLLSFANKVDESSNEFLHFNNNLHSDIIKQFIFIRKMQRFMYEITQELSNFYSFPILLAIISSCLWMIISLFIIIFYHNIKSPHTNFHNLFMLLVDSSWIFKEFIPILVLSCYITRIITEVCIQ